MRASPLALAALLLTAPAPALAQDLAAAHAFVMKLYQGYQQGDGPDYLGAQAPQVFSPGLLRLIRRDAAHTPKGEVGALDGDPICNCQDFEMSAIQVQVSAAGRGRARAWATFVNAGQPQAVSLDLVAVKGHWRVADVHAQDMPSLVALLTQGGH